MPKHFSKPKKQGYSRPCVVCGRYVTPWILKLQLVEKGNLLFPPERMYCAFCFKTKTENEQAETLKHTLTMK